METTWLSINWWVDKDSVLHVYDETLFSCKKDVIALSFVTVWMVYGSHNINWTKLGLMFDVSET